MPKTTEPIYSGELAKKFPAPKPGEESVTEAFRAGWYDRLMLVFDLHGVRRPNPFSNENEVRWRQLAMRLAFIHVPALQIANPGGAPKRWGNEQCRKLYVEVMSYRHKGWHNTEACIFLARTPYWSSFLKDSDHPAKTLLRKFHDIQKHQPNLVAFVEEIKRRWPDEIEDNLSLVTKPSF